MKREQAQSINPVIGDSLADTLANASNTLDAASLFGEGDQMAPGEAVRWGRMAFVQTIKSALEFEAGQL